MEISGHPVVIVLVLGAALALAALVGAAMAARATRRASDDGTPPGLGDDRPWLDAIGDIVLVFEPEGRLRYANATAQAQLNVEEPDATELAHLFRSDREASAFLSETWRGACEGKRHHGLEMTLQGRHGRAIPAFVSLYPLSQRGNRFVVLVAHDLTSFREVQAALLAERGERDERGVSWLDQVQDELRTPLREILEHTESLDPSAQAVRERATLALHLLTDVIDLVQLDAGRLPLREEPLNLPHVIERARPLFDGPNGPRQRVEVTCENLPVVGDPGRLVQALQGIVSYALRAGGGPIRLVASRDRAETVLEIAVSDASVAAEQVEAALRGEAEAEPDARVRVALMLAAKICQASGGSVKVRPRGPLLPLSFVVRLRATPHTPSRPVASEASTLLE